MKELRQFKDKSSLFFIIAILILCAGFIFESCGTSPQEKVRVLGDYAIDITRAPSGIEDNQPVRYGGVHIEVADSKFPRIAGTAFTVEAWVKRKTDLLQGAIFSHNDASNGFLLWVDDNTDTNKPRFSILFDPEVGTTTLLTVTCGVPLALDTWTHIAGSLVYENHLGVHPSCGGAEAEIPHLDFYLMGQFNACASTQSENATHGATDITPSSDNTRKARIGFLTHNVDVNEDGNIDENDLTTTTRFDGAIDEVRYWVAQSGETEARSAAQILRCYNQKLKSSGPCTVGNPNLKGYWPFDEGSGFGAADASGNKFAGTIFSPFGYNWDDAWTTDTPF